MGIYINGTLIGQSNKVFLNGVQISSTGKVYGNGTQVWTGGTLTLKEVVFNASGTFTMPSGVVDNQIIVGCTGGGGSSLTVYKIGTVGGNGAGRVVSTITMSPGQTATVTVGAGGLVNSSGGGTSSFTGANSCAGGTLGSGDAPTNGGGRGVWPNKYPSTASNCPATLSLKNGAVDSTTGLWTAKSFPGGSGGGGCYGAGGQPAANSGAGGYNNNGGSGKVVVWYYTYE